MDYQLVQNKRKNKILEKNPMKIKISTKEISKKEILTQMLNQQGDGNS